MPAIGSMLPLLLLPLLLALAAINPAAGFQITDCTRGKQADAKLLSLTIDTCPDAVADRCDFIKGRNATMTLDFEPTAVFSQANIKIFGKLGPILIPFRFNGPTNACGNYGFECPVEVGVQQTMQISLPVEKSYPSIKTVVRFELNDERAAPIVCFEFPVQLRAMDQGDQ